PLRTARLGRADVHAAIQRHRIHGDDLSAQPLGQLQAESALARAGGTGEDQSMLKRLGDHAAILLDDRSGALAGFMLWAGKLKTARLLQTLEVRVRQTQRVKAALAGKVNRLVDDEGIVHDGGQSVERAERHERAPLAVPEELGNLVNLC